MMKTKVSVIGAKRSSLAALPSSVRTRGGAAFDPRSDFWSYRDGVSRVCINFTPIAGLLSSEMQQSLKVVLLGYAENASPHHINNMHFLFCHFVKYIWEAQGAAIQSVASIDLLNYKASLSTNRAWFLTNLSGFLKKWHRLRLPGVAEDVVSLLRDLRLKGNPRGVAVRTMDTVAGPYTDIELGAIQTALNDSFADGSIADDMYLLAWLFIALGQRPSQFAALKVGDVSGVPIDGQVHYNLQVPRAKQRDAHLRTQFKNRPLVSQIGKPLLEYAQRIRHRFEGRLAEPKDAPLFPSAVEVEGAPGYEFHFTGGNLSRRLSDTLRGLRVYSERTGDLLQISAIRFRRTFGTRAAQEGHGELVIAELLDHSDTQNVGVYVASVPEIAARIDRAIAMELAPLAQAFKGALINDESEATRCGDPSSRILDRRINRGTKPMGSCGQYSFCSFNAPIACYTCRYFEPWLDGPHEAVLKHLLEQREQLLVTTDRRMAAINDRTILAVAEVIQLCREAAEVVSNG